MTYETDALIATDIEAYLKQHENKELLRFLTCGNVDDGKSTLIGRLLHDSKMIYEDQLEAVTRDSVKSGTTGNQVDLALLVDGLQAEREQRIVISPPPNVNLSLLIRQVMNSTPVTWPPVHQPVSWRLF